MINNVTRSMIHFKIGSAKKCGEKVGRFLSLSDSSWQGIMPSISLENVFGSLLLNILICNLFIFLIPIHIAKEQSYKSMFEISIQCRENSYF